jgi:hypothetical protein
MNQKTQTQDRPDKTADKNAAKKESSSDRATKEARKGEPLSADKQRDRSPKQENL